MELYTFKVGSRYWIFKKSSKLNRVLTEPRFWVMIVVIVMITTLINDCCH